jgi:hypothetical protein
MTHSCKNANNGRSNATSSATTALPRLMKTKEEDDGDTIHDSILLELSKKIVKTQGFQQQF